MASQITAVDNKVKFSVGKCNTFNTYEELQSFTLSDVKVTMDDGVEVSVDKVRMIVREGK